MSNFSTAHPPSAARAFARAAACAALAAGASLAGSAFAQNAPDGAAQLSQIGQRFADEALQQGMAGAGALPLRMEVQMGQLDPRLRLAACAKVEPYLPAGSRLWGRTRLGLRCLQGAVAWNVFLPITVKAWGPAWVLQNGVPSGRPLSAGDAVQAEVDWAEDSAAVYANQQDWVGLVASAHWPQARHCARTCCARRRCSRWVPKCVFWSMVVVFPSHRRARPCLPPAKARPCGFAWIMAGSSPGW